MAAGAAAEGRRLVFPVRWVRYWRTLTRTRPPAASAAVSVPEPSIPVDGADTDASAGAGAGAAIDAGAGAGAVLVLAVQFIAGRRVPGRALAGGLRGTVCTLTHS